MPFAIIIIVGLVLYTEVVDSNKVKEAQQESATEVTSTKSLESKPIQQQVKVIPKKPESIKEETKIEPKQTEFEKEEAKIKSLKEEIKIETKQPENVKEEPKVETKQPENIKEEPLAEKKELEVEEGVANETEINYLKIILYIVAAIAFIFGGFYLFSTRGKNRISASSTDSSRKDIEETYQSDTQEIQSTPQEPQETQEPQSTPQETQEPQSTPQEPQETQEPQSTPQEPQEQQSKEEPAQTEVQEQEQKITEEDENNNKQ